MRVKKHLAIILITALIVLSVLPTEVAEAASDYSYIKVKLSSMGSVTSAKFTVNGEYYIKENPYYTLVRGKTYTVKKSGSGVALVDGSLSTYLGTSATFVRCESSSSTNWLTLNNTKTGWTNYPGDMTFVRDGSYITSICKLYMETYLVGVVAHEMSPNWPAEALKAQAVAARTYAMRYIYPGNTYDVVDTTSNQVYKGFNPSRDQPVIDAISATKGIAMYYGSSFADGVYSASNGGQTQSRVPVWGSVNLYHELKDDPYDMKNPASPRFEFYFPKIVTTANTLTSKLKEMLLSAISAKLGISKSSITIMGIESVTPYELPANTKYGAYPAGSRKFQKVSVKVDYSTGGATIPTEPTPSLNPGETWTGTVRLQSSSRLRIRSGPSTNDSIAGYVPNGGEVTIYEQRSDGWYKIKYDNINGYVYGSYILVNTPTAASATDVPTATPAPQDINQDAQINSAGEAVVLRESADEGSAALVYIADGADIYILQETHDGWLKAEYSSIEGYIPVGKVSYDIPTASPSPTATDATPTLSPSQAVTPVPAPQYSQVTVRLVFDDMQSTFAGDSSYLKYHSILDVYESSDNKTIVLRAGRFGHGIGMSQRGAQQMANEGKNYQFILDFYYHGTELRNMNVVKVPLPVKAQLPTTVGVVLADSLNVRSGPGSSYSVITGINKGETVNVIVEGSWCKIYVPGKKVVGYVAREYLDITYPAPTATIQAPFAVHEGIYKVTATRLNMRSGPSTDFSIVTTLDNAELVTRYGASGTFYKVEDASGREGWCSSKYLEMVSAAVTPTPAPTADPDMEGSVAEGKKIYLRQETEATGLFLAILESLDTFTIIEDRADGWLKIEFDSLQGFIEDDFAVFDGTKEDYYESGNLTADETMYNAADLASNAVIDIPSGSDVWVIADRDDGWVQIEWESEVGFIIDDNLTFDGQKEGEQPTESPSESPTESPTEEATPSESPTETTSETPTPSPSPSDTQAPTGELSQDEKLYDTTETYGQVLAHIASGSQVTILEDRGDGWVHAEYNSLQGYIIDDYIDFDGTKEDTDEYRGAWAKTTSGTQILYNEPSTIAYVLKYVPEGTYVHLIADRDDGFIKVDDDGVVGYMVDDDIEFDGTKEDPTADDPPDDSTDPQDDDPSELIGTVTAQTGSVRLRKSASLTSDILAYVPVDTEVVVLEDRDDGWVYLNYSDLLGYMVDDYVDFDGTKEDHEPAPTASPAPTEPPTSEVLTGTVKLEYSTSRLRIRSSASTSSSILGHIPNGGKVKVLEKLSSGWLKVEYSGVSGYVSKDYVEFDESSAQTTGKIVNCSYLNFRSGPDTSYSSNGSIKAGTKVPILGSSDGWYKISYNSKEGWVSGKYVSIDSGGTAPAVTVTGTGKITASSLRVRNGAGLNNSQIGSLSKGTTVEILGESNGFYKIEYEDQAGYISKTYVDVS